jgi:hypothetical protein
MNAPVPFAPQANFDVGALYAGQYLTAEDLGGNTYTAIIVAVERVEVTGQDGSVKAKAAITLQGWPKKLLSNKTNFETIAAAYGRQSAGWIGKPIEVFPATTPMGPRTVACIRVRVPRPAAPAAAVPGMPTSAPAAPAAAVPNGAPAAAPPAQVAMLPPLMTAADFADDIPY